MARTINLNDTQLVLLSTAAGREDRMVLPPPQSVPLDDPGTRKALQGLLRRSLVEEVVVGIDAPTWRTGEADQTLGLAITEDGLSAISLGEIAGDTPTPPKTKATNPTKRKSRSASKREPIQKAARKAPAKTTGKSSGHAARSTTRVTKADAVLALLRRKSGVTMAQMMEATGWQAHSVRGFLSGTVKRQMGFALVSEKKEGSERRYRIAGGKA